MGGGIAREELNISKEREGGGGREREKKRSFFSLVAEGERELKERDLSGKENGANPFGYSGLLPYSWEKKYKMRCFCLDGFIIFTYLENCKKTPS